MKKTMADRLLAWYDVHGRTLPFRGTKDPYRIWLSEIMLQQTRTETVGVYFMNFLSRFPDVFALAAAPEEEVLKMWEGLGYYSRARNLHKAARMVVRQWQGIFPADYEALLSLPGVGEYTAAAIASIAFDLPCPAMDGNLTRVLSRFHGVRENVERPSVKRQLLALAGEDMPPCRCGDFNQALMDLGASHCCPGTPECEKCPLKGMCSACREGDADLLPLRSAKKAPRPVDVEVLLITCGGKILMEKRRETLLKDMWVYPMKEDVLKWCAPEYEVERWGIEVEKGQRLGDARHVFTHRIWQMEIWHCPVGATPQMPEHYRWCTLSQMEQLPIPTAMKAARQYARNILTEGLEIYSTAHMPYTMWRSMAWAYWQSFQDVHRGASRAYLEEHTPTYMEMLLRGYAAMGKDVYCLALGEEAAGVMVLDLKENELCGLYVQPLLQKKGIGTRAVQFALRHLDESRDMHVTALDSAPHAIRMYQKAGFTKTSDHRLLDKEEQVWETCLVRPGNGTKEDTTHGTEGTEN